MLDSDFTIAELSFIEGAAKFFEDPNIFMRGINLLSSGVEKAQSLLPTKAQKAISKAVRVSLEKAVLASSKTISPSKQNLTLSEAVLLRS